MKKKKTVLSLYASKKRRKLKKRDGNRIGRPRNLQFPRSSKDHDVTFGYEEEKMSESEDEGKTSIEEESFQFRVDVGASCQGAENMAGPPSSSSSPPSSSPSSSSSDSESDDEDFWNRPYIRNCCRQLKNDNFVRNLVQKLYRSQCLRDFILLVTQLADGSLSPLNIAFLLCLERAKWQSLKSTTQMRFRNVTKKFWLVVYRLLKGKGLRFFSGPKNYGQVISKETTKGKYDPKKSEINFAVPDERYLRTQDRVLGRLISPGIIKDSMQIIRNHKDIVLMADCKRVAKGLRSDRMGDVDLWGHEKPPTLQQKLNQFRDECNHIKRSIELLPNASLLDVHDNLKYLLQLITYKIRDVREIENVERKRLLNYEKLNPDPNYKSSAKGACCVHIYDCKMFINNALELNQSLCKYMSLLQKTSCMFNNVRVRLQDQLNCRRLLPPNYVAQHATVTQHPDWFQQHSR